MEWNVRFPILIALDVNGLLAESQRGVGSLGSPTPYFAE